MNVSEIISRIKSAHTENIVDYIESFDQICVWGTGAGADMVAQGFEKNEVNIAFFIDNDSSKWGTIFHGKEVKPISDIPQNVLVIIAASPLYNIHEQLENDHKEYLYLDPVFVYFGGLEEGHRECIMNLLDSNSDKINKVLALLEDDESEELYADLLVHRAVHNITLLLKHYQPNQYFGNDLVPFAEGTIVDCGAFQGDTLKRYLSQTGSTTDYSYYAFEADKHNFDILKNFCLKEDLRNVYPLNYAVSDKDGKVVFQNNGDNMMGGGIVKGIFEQKKCDVVNAITLDSIMCEKHVDYIMADIEGAELMLLDGARKIIKTDMPVLAISAYHRLEDMWDIPLRIREINSKYNICFRHHMVNLSDTVCYALK